MRHLSSPGARSVLSCILLLILHVSASATVYNVKNAPCNAVGNGIADDTNAINVCIASLAPGDTLLFPAGTYRVSSLAGIAVNSVIVDGSSSAATINGSSGAVMTIGAYGLSSNTPLLAVAPELSTTIQANWSAIGVVAGSYIYIEQGGAGGGTHTCGGSGCRSEVLKIASVSGNTATVTTAVHQTYDPVSNLAWVEKVANPVSGVTVHDLNLDGNNTASSGLQILNAVDSTFTNLNIQHAVGCGAPLFTGGGLYALLGFNNAFNNITIMHVGSATNGGFCEAAELDWQGNVSVNGFAISNLNLGMLNPLRGTFGISIVGEANGTFSNVSVDNAGTGAGRPFKLNSAVYNTFNGLTVQHSEGQYYGGITINYYSSHNTFNNCQISNLASSNAGIQIYGNIGNGANEGNNHYNTFNNCTISAPGNIAVWNIDSNDHMEINGGSYSGISGGQVIAVGYSAASNNAYIHNATINSPGSPGIALINGTGSCVNNNTFSGISTTVSSSSNTNVGGGNSPNGGNLTAGTCGTAGTAGTPPSPPTGLTAIVQ